MKNADTRIVVGVIFGGKSVEHEVSVISGLQAYHSLNKEKYRALPIYISKEGNMYVGEKIKDISEYKNIDNLLKCSTRITLVNNGEKTDIIRCSKKLFENPVIDSIDVALPVVHGTNVEDGNLQGFLHSISCPYAGCDVISSALGMDKYASKIIMEKAGIPVLHCIVIKRNDYISDEDSSVSKIESELRYPVIVKPVNLGSSVGIKKAKNKDDLICALDYAFEFAGRVLIENAVISLKEVNCSVLGDKDGAVASVCEEPINHDEILSYADKYLQGSGKSSKLSGAKGQSSGMADTKRKLPAEIDNETRDKIQKYAVDAFMALGCCGVSRIDFLIDNETGDIYVNEINTIPGSLSFYLWEASGMHFDELLDKLIKLAFKRNREEKNINYTFDTNILSGVSFGKASGKA